MQNCFNCGHALVWSADFNPEDYGIEDDTDIILVSHWTCPICGSEYDAFIRQNNLNNAKAN